jgi:hypothetical protein
MRQEGATKRRHEDWEERGRTRGREEEEGRPTSDYNHQRGRERYTKYESSNKEELDRRPVKRLERREKERIEGRTKEKLYDVAERGQKEENNNIEREKKTQKEDTKEGGEKRVRFTGLA